MKRKSLDRFVDKYCKIVTKESGDKKVRVTVGIVKDINHDAGFMIVESDEGSIFLKIESIMAIKPRRKLWVLFGF